MLREWLQSSPNPTWSQLVEALRSPDINRPGIAAEIEGVYIKNDHSSVQKSQVTAGEWYIPCLPWAKLTVILHVLGGEGKV